MYLSFIYVMKNIFIVEYSKYAISLYQYKENFYAHHFLQNVLVSFSLFENFKIFRYKIYDIFSPYTETYLLAYDYETAGMMLTCCINLNVSPYKRKHNKAILSWKINFALKILLYKYSNKTGRSYGIAPRKQIKLYLLCYIYCIRYAAFLRVCIYECRFEYLTFWWYYIHHTSVDQLNVISKILIRQKKKEDRFRDATARSRLHSEANQGWQICGREARGKSHAIQRFAHSHDRSDGNKFTFVLPRMSLRF